MTKRYEFQKTEYRFSDVPDLIKIEEIEERTRQYCVLCGRRICIRGEDCLDLIRICFLLS